MGDMALMHRSGRASPAAEQVLGMGSSMVLGMVLGMGSRAAD